MEKIKKMPKKLEKEFFEIKEEITNINVVSLSARSAKGFISSAKTNYSKKELEKFEEFLKI